MSSNRSRRMAPTSAPANVQAGFRAGREAAPGERPWASVAGCAPFGRRGRADPTPRARPPRPPWSVIPIRFALPITALRDSAPSVAAMTLALNPSVASLFRLSTASSVQSISLPQFFAADRFVAFATRTAAWVEGLKPGIRSNDRRENETIGPPGRFTENFQFSE